MNRPYVVCHMVTSIDGKVTGQMLNSAACEAAADWYYEVNRQDPAEAYACGRVTMEGSFTRGWQPSLVDFEGEDVPPDDYVACTTAPRYAVSFDRRARLGWQQPCIEDADPGYGGAHIISVVTSAASPSMLAYWRSIGLSYIIAGETQLDVSLALSKLRKLFGIERLLLEGGAELNGAFLRAGVVDELSLVIAPVLGGEADKSLFTPAGLCACTLLSCESREGGLLYARYQLTP